MGSNLVVMSSLLINRYLIQVHPNLFDQIIAGPEMILLIICYMFIALFFMAIRHRFIAFGMFCVFLPPFAWFGSCLWFSKIFS